MTNIIRFSRANINIILQRKNHLFNIYSPVECGNKQQRKSEEKMCFIKDESIKTEMNGTGWGCYSGT